MERLKIFKDEINYIKDKDLKEDTKILINLLPNYFFEVGASSTGKYHPNFTVGKLGLVKHVKAACKFAKELLDNPLIGKNYSDREKDLIIIALLFHDGIKYGIEKEDYTRFEHALLAADFISDNKDKLNMNDEDIDILRKIISSHMGPWNTNSYSNIVLPVPETPIEKFVHMCDYLASRKFLEIAFDKDNNIIDESKN